MNNRRYYIYSRPFSEYTYRELKNSNATQRAMLSERELKMLSDDSLLSEFVHNHPFDHLLAVLAKIGKTWALRVAETDETAEQLEFNTINQFDFPEKRMEVIEAQVREKVHYLSSNDLILTMLMGAQNTHTSVYSLSANSLSASKRMRAFKSTKSAYHDQIDDAVEAWDDINRMMLAQLSSFHVEQWQQVVQNQVDMRVMCALFDKRYGAMTMKEVSVATCMEGKMAFLKKSMERLVKDKVIMNDAKSGEKSNKATYYMITGEGIKLVMKYHDSVYSKTFKQ